MNEPRARGTVGRRDVFVRGVGAVTPLGPDWPTSLAALARGACAIRPVSHFDVTGFPCTVAAAIVDGPPLEPTHGEDRRLPLALTAAAEAWRRAAVRVPAERIGVFVGAESARPSFATVVGLVARAEAAGDEHDAVRASLDDSRARAVARVCPAAVAAALAAVVGARGPAQTISLACASSAVAVAEGLRAIEQGRCDVALCGGVGADVDPFMMAGFGLLGALSERGCSRPFDARRDGFVLGEAAAFVVLAAERGDAAVALRAAGRSVDAHHITSPDPTGAGAERAMRAALAQAGLARVDVVQAHGTSTPQNDAVEAAALRRVFADVVPPQVGSVKGALGHSIAAAGALGLLCAVAAVEHGVRLPTVGLEQVDVDCVLDHVQGRTIHAPAGSAMVNSFAFGGANCSLVVARA